MGTRTELTSAVFPPLRHLLYPPTISGPQSLGCEFVEKFVAAAFAIVTVVLVVGLIARDVLTGNRLWKSKENWKEANKDYRPAEPSADKEPYYWSYYELQYVRVAAHESYRLQVSSFVLAGSVAALGLLAAKDKPEFEVLLAAAAGIVAVNAFAIAFSTNSRKWVKVHQARASDALQALSRPLKSLQNAANRRYGIRENSDDRHAFFRSSVLLSSIHAAVATVAALLVYLQACSF